MILKLNTAALKANALKHLRKHDKELYNGDEKLEWNQVFGTVTFQVSAEDEATYSLNLEPDFESARAEIKKALSEVCAEFTEEGLH